MMTPEADIIASRIDGDGSFGSALRASSDESNDGNLSPPFPAVVDTVAKPSQVLEFVHIPKTGGSAIEYVASLANITWGLCHFKKRGRAGPGCHTPNWANHGLDRNLDYSKVDHSWEIWHAPPSWFKVDSPYVNKALFAVVRHPYERLLSEYYCPYMGLNPIDWTDETLDPRDPMGPSLEEARKDKAKQKTKSNSTKTPETPESLNAFVMDRLSYKVKWTAHYLPQSDFVYNDGSSGDRIVEHVLRFENLKEEFARLMERYHLPVYLNFTINKNGSANNRLTVQDLYPSTIRRINKVYRRDFQNFGYNMIDPDDASK